MDRTTLNKFDAFLKTKGQNNSTAGTTNLYDDKPLKRSSSIRFTDDQTVNDGQKMTPELLHRKSNRAVDTVREQVTVSLAEQLSAEFSKSKTIGFDKKLLDGFTFAFEVDNDTATGMGTQNNNNSSSDIRRRVIQVVADKRCDARLTEILASALSTCALIPSIEIKVQLVAHIVANAMGGGYLISDQKVSQFYNESQKEFCTSTDPLLKLGDISKGFTAIRALLFKYICDRLDVPCKVSILEGISSHYASLNIHGVARIQHGNSTPVIDLISRVGCLYEGAMARHCEELEVESLLASVDKKNSNLQNVPDVPNFSRRWFEEIDFTSSQVQLLNLIGKGRYGQVYKAKVGNLICALKNIRMQSMTKDIRKSIQKELSLMRRLKHPNIVTYLGQETIHENEMNLFLELVSKPLDKVVESIKSHERSVLTRNEVILIAKGIASALNYIHTLPAKLMHRDIKARNVLVELSDEGVIIQAKLCDFGLAIEVTNDKENQLSVGTSRWMAPEVHAMNRYDEKVDIWSYGMLIYELCSMKLPYHDVCVLDVKTEILKGKVIDYEAIIPELREFSALVASCVQFDSKSRPSAQDLLTRLDQVE